MAARALRITNLPIGQNTSQFGIIGFKEFLVNDAQFFFWEIFPESFDFGYGSGIHPSLYLDPTPCFCS
jgi:hypothetical protein